jgi:peptidoglycan/LPS O-acetylase OafA/YrhL
MLIIQIQTQIIIHVLEEMVAVLTTIQVLPPTHQEVLTVTILTDATTLGIGLLITTIVEQPIRRQIQLGTILQVEVRQVVAQVAVAAEVVHVVQDNINK